jgi:hypothetical protein
MPNTKPKSTLRLLAETILDAVSRVEDHFDNAGLDFPSLDDPFNPTHPTTALLFRSEVAADIDIVVGATEQLSVTISPPMRVILEAAVSVNLLQMLQCRIMVTDSF